MGERKYALRAFLESGKYREEAKVNGIPYEPRRNSYDDGVITIARENANQIIKAHEKSKPGKNIEVLVKLEEEIED